MADEKKRGLGRGLSALFGEEETTPVVLDPPAAKPAAPGARAPAAEAARSGGVRDVPIEFLRPNPQQPRRSFSEDELDDLARSIKERGVLQPIIVRPVGKSGTDYQIVAGERRWRAAQRAQRHTVPVIVKELSDSETLEIALIENIQRSDLSAVEEAGAYSALMQRFGYTQDQLSKVMGKSRSHVANTIRLLSLPMPVQRMVTENKLSAGHARTLIGCDDAEAVAKEIISKGLNVRQTEALVKRRQSPVPPPKARGIETIRRAVEGRDKDADTLALERNVSNALGLAVTIEHEGPKGGAVLIEYKTLEQLDEICRRLAGG